MEKLQNKSKKENQISTIVDSLVVEILKNIKTKNIENIVSKIRTVLYFSESFSFEDFEMKKTNCVGANYLLFNVLEKVFPNDIFKFVSITYPALETSGHLSKHICVAQIKDTEIKFMDATPMAGFFNGRVSKWISLDEWAKDKDMFVSKKEMSFKDFENRYAHSFSFLSKQSVMNVLKFICFKEEKDEERFSIENLPKAWYADLLKDKALNVKSKKEKNKLLKQSYELSENPFTYLKLYPDRQHSSVVTGYVKHNEFIIKQIDSYLKQNKKISKKLYSEYLAVKYWKSSANKQIMGSKFEFKNIEYKKERVYLYKMGRSYFKDNNLVLLKSIKNNKSQYEIMSKEVSIKMGDKNILIFTGFNAYKELVLAISPEVIII